MKSKVVYQMNMNVAVNIHAVQAQLDQNVLPLTPLPPPKYKTTNTIKTTTTITATITETLPRPKHATHLHAVKYSQVECGHATRGISEGRVGLEGHQKAIRLLRCAIEKQHLVYADLRVRNTGKAVMDEKGYNHWWERLICTITQLQP